MVNGHHSSPDPTHPDRTGATNFPAADCDHALPSARKCGEVPCRRGQPLGPGPTSANLGEVPGDDPQDVPVRGCSLNPVAHHLAGFTVLGLGGQLLLQKR